MDAQKWYSFSLAGQMANIGSEVARLVNLKELGKKEAMEKSLVRALELIDLTLADARWRSRLREVARLREVLADFCLGRGFFVVSGTILENYFLPFALLARKNV